MKKKKIFTAVLLITAAIWLFVSCGSDEKTAESTQQTAVKEGAAKALVIPDVQTYPEGIPYRGVNLAGGAFMDDAKHLASNGYFLPGLMDAVLFIYKGMNIFRVPIAWEYLAKKDGSFKADTAGLNYQLKLRNIVDDLTGKKALIILDLHNYMRYNPTNVSLDYQNTDPNGPDVIGSGSDAPTKENFAKLWKNIVSAYPGTNIIYGIMNEPHDIAMQQLIDCQNSAVSAIREQEKADGILQPHLILIDGNSWSGLHSWTTTTQYGCNADVYPQQIRDPMDNTAFDVHQYLDKNSSGGSPICIDYNDFTGQFNQYWATFTSWAREKKAKLFLGEFGIADNDNCKKDLKYLLDHVSQFPYKEDSGGFLGWTVWAAGKGWGGENILSIAPGGAANTLMWDFYPQYLIKRAPLPPLGPKAVSLKNNSDVTLIFAGGAWPWQKEGSANLNPGGIAYIYKQDVTPGEQAEIAYQGGNVGFGIDANGYGFAWSNIAGLKTDKLPSCDLGPGLCLEIKNESTSRSNSPSWSYGQPFATTNPSSGNSYKPISSHFPVKGNTMFNNLKPPYPTNNWFINLLLGKGQAGNQKAPYQGDPASIGWASVYPYPYTININEPTSPSPRKSLGVGCWPYNVVYDKKLDPNFNKYVYGVIYDAAAHKFIGCTEDVQMCTLKSYDDFSATLLWEQNGGTGSMEAPIVRGMPYVTMVYNGLTPAITNFSPGIIEINGKSIDEVKKITIGGGNVATLTLAGAAQPSIGPSTWVLYASETVTFDCCPTSLTAEAMSGGYKGYIRLAYVTTRDNDPNYSNKDKRIAVLKNCAPYYPTGGTFNAAIDSGSPDKATMTFTWKTNKKPPSPQSFCMYALPHQLDLLPASLQNLLAVNVLKGTMIGVYGTTWTMTENLITFDWNGTRNLANLSKDKCDQLFNTLVDDNKVLCTGTKYCYANTCKPDTYFGAKEMAKWGHMAVIADELADLYKTGGKYPDSTKYTQCQNVAQNIRARLKSFLQPWLDGTNLPWVDKQLKQDYLRYDTKMGGIIDQNDYDVVGSNFLNSLYTDHHFHYGYFIYAAAAIAKVEPDWVKKYDAKVKALARDIANPAADTYFPKNRYHDWYDGNSWADGLVGDGGGRNQESISEACNAWYGIYLYGLATGDDNMKNTGRLLLASEIRSAQTYWHILPGSEYPKFYTDQYKVVCILYSEQISSKSFFGVAPRYSYGIQVIPNTPVNQLLLRKSWTDEICKSGIIDQLVISPPANPLTGPPHERDEMVWATINLVIQARSQDSQALAYYRKHLSQYIWQAPNTPHQYNVNYDDGTCRTILLRDILVNGSN